MSCTLDIVPLLSKGSTTSLVNQVLITSQALFVRGARASLRTPLRPGVTGHSVCCFLAERLNELWVYLGSFSL